MKKILLLLLISISLYADIKVDTIESKMVNYENGMLFPSAFKILCINGYQWLQFGIDTHGSISQMFTQSPYGTAIPIKCENK